MTERITNALMQSATRHAESATRCNFDIVPTSNIYSYLYIVSHGGHRAKVCGPSTRRELHDALTVIAAAAESIQRNCPDSYR